MNIASPSPPQSPHDALLSLLALIADPEAAKARLAQLIAAADEARALSAKAKDAPEQIKNLLRDYEAERERASLDHERKLMKSSKAFDEKCETRLRDIQAKEARAAEMEATAKANVEATAGLREDLERRLAHIKAAAT